MYTGYIPVSVVVVITASVMYTWYDDGEYDDVDDESLSEEKHTTKKLIMRRGEA